MVSKLVRGTRDKVEQCLPGACPLSWRPRNSYLMCHLHQSSELAFHSERALAFSAHNVCSLEFNVCKFGERYLVLQMMLTRAQLAAEKFEFACKPLNLHLPGWRSLQILHQ
jgi:hypothetical protein